MSTDRYIVHWYRGRYEGITGPFTPTTAMKIRREWVRKPGRVGKVVIASSHDEAFNKTIDWKENPMRVVWKSSRYLINVVSAGDTHIVVEAPGGHRRNFSDERSAVAFAKKVEEGMNHQLPAEQAWQYAKRKALQSNPTLHWIDRGYDHGIHLWETDHSPKYRWQITTRVAQRPQSFTLYPPTHLFGSSPEKFRKRSFPTLEDAKRYASTLIGENPLSGAQTALIAAGVIGAAGLAYLLFAKPAAASTTGPTKGGTPEPSPQILQVTPGETTAISLVLGNSETDALPGTLWIQDQNNESVTATVSPAGVVSLTYEAGLGNAYQVTALATGTATVTWSDGTTITVTVVPSSSGGGGSPPLLNVYSGTSGATYHVPVGTPIQFNLPTPDSGYTWIDSESGDSVLGGEIINTIVSSGWQEVGTVEQTGTQTITWTQEDANGNPNPNGATYSWTITAS